MRAGIPTMFYISFAYVRNIQYIPYWCVYVCVCVWQDHTDSIESVMLNQLFNFKMQNDAALVLVISNGRVCVCVCVCTMDDDDDDKMHSATTANKVQPDP